MRAGKDVKGRGEHGFERDGERLRRTGRQDSRHAQQGLRQRFWFDLARRRCLGAAQLYSGCEAVEGVHVDLGGGIAGQVIYTKLSVNVG